MVCGGVDRSSSEYAGGSSCEEGFDAFNEAGLVGESDDDVIVLEQEEVDVV